MGERMEGGKERGREGEGEGARAKKPFCSLSADNIHVAGRRGGEDAHATAQLEEEEAPLRERTLPLLLSVCLSENNRQQMVSHYALTSFFQEGEREGGEGAAPS